MGGLMRLKPTIIPDDERRKYTCTTKGCPDAAVVVLPMNLHADADLRARPDSSFQAERLSTKETYRSEDGGPLEMRLCRKCVRTLATALPPGMRLPGARLWYPELPPGTAAAPDEIPYTPEWLAENDQGVTPAYQHVLNAVAEKVQESVRRINRADDPVATETDAAKPTARRSSGRRGDR